MRNQTGIRGESQKEKKAGRWKLLPVVLVIVGVVVAAVCLTSAPFSSKSSRTVIAGGETYVQRADITTILLLGIDKRETLENESGRPADNGQSDMIWLIAVDHSADQIRIITIPRETMADVEEHYSDGSVRKVYEQVCLQYAYGTTPEEGCALTEETIKIFWRRRRSIIPVRSVWELSQNWWMLWAV